IVLGLSIYLFLIVPYRGIFAIACVCALLTFQNNFWNLRQDAIAQDRNYFGVIKVTAHEGAHYLYHGTTLHGAQPQDEEHKLKPVTYYGAEGPVGDMFKAGGKRIAGIGLGV